MRREQIIEATKLTKDTHGCIFRYDCYKNHTESLFLPPIITYPYLWILLFYHRERRRHLFSTDKKKENADMVYSIVKRHKCHTKELRDILDTLSDTSYDVDISAQMTEKHPSDFYLNGSFDPSEGKTPPDDLSHWYRSSLLIQVVPEGQTHTLMVSDLHPTPDTESVDDLYSQILRGKHNEDTAPEEH